MVMMGPLRQPQSTAVQWLSWRTRRLRCSLLLHGPPLRGESPHVGNSGQGVQGSIEVHASMYLSEASRSSGVLADDDCGLNTIIASYQSTIFFSFPLTSPNLTPNRLSAIVPVLQSSIHFLSFQISTRQRPSIVLHLLLDLFIPAASLINPPPPWWSDIPPSFPGYQPFRFLESERPAGLNAPARQPSSYSSSGPPSLQQPLRASTCTCT